MSSYGSTFYRHFGFTSAYSTANLLNVLFQKLNQHLHGGADVVLMVLDIEGSSDKGLHNGINSYSYDG